MHRTKTTLCAAALLLGLIGGARAQTAHEQLQAFADGLQALRGNFVQVTQAGDQKVDESRGDLALKAPRYFRWRYRTPYPQLIVADGLNVWIHDPDLQQVTVRPQSGAEAQSPLTVLTDLSLLEREYTLRALPDEAGLRWMRLTPKAKDPPFVHCDLGFAGNQLRRMRIRDSLSQYNEWRFSDWERNPKLAESVFRFEVPEGTDVVGTPAKGAEVFTVPGDG